MKRNILLIFGIIILSIILAIPFGNFLNKYVFTIRGGFGTFSLPTDLSSIINGLVVAYLFSVSFILISFCKSHRLILTIILSLPAIIFSYIISIQYLFWSVIFFISGLIIALIIQKLLKSKSSQV